MNRTVIYTSLTGNYDTLPQYPCLDPSFDYICFSNDYPDGSKQGMWTIRKIPYEHKDNIILSRFVKLNPHIALPEYNYSVWLDSNILITSEAPYNRFKELILDNVILAMIAHPFRDCIYEEAIACVEQGRSPYKMTKKQIAFLHSQNYPKHNGLYENNIIIRCQNLPIIKTASEEWWNLFMKFTKRDQLSFCFILWRHHITPTLIFPKGINTRNVKGLMLKKHSRPNLYKRIFTFLKRELTKIELKISPILP